MNNKDLKRAILESIGGEENLVNVTHCATRLRLVLKDESKIDEEKLKNTEGIINTIKMGEQYQLIIGPSVKDLYNEFGGISPDINGTNDTPKRKFDVKKIFQNLFSFLGACVGVYIIPLIGGGLVKAGLTLFVQFGLLQATSGTYTTLWFASDAVFQFLPIFIALGAARKLNANEMLAVYTVCIMISPVFISAINDGSALSIFGINIPLISYYNGFLPAVITVVVMAYLERGLKIVIPKSAQQFLLPFLIILIMTPISLLVTGPIAQELGNLLAMPLISMGDYTWVVVTLLGFFMPIMIMFGLHSAVFTFTFTVILPAYGYDPVFMPASLCVHMAMGAVALAVSLKSKNKAIKTTAISACLTTWIGSISEPVVFGVLAQNKFAMIAACLGGGTASLVAGLFGLKCYAVAGSGFMHAPTFIGPESSWVLLVVSIAISIVVSMIVVFTFYKDSKQNEVNIEESL